MDRLHRKRLRRYDVPGHAHYLTFSCYRQQALLGLDVPRRYFLEALAGARSKVAFHLWAYVVMPEHVHLLVWPLGETKVSNILRHVKLPVAKRARLLALGGCTDLLAVMGVARSDGRQALRFWQRGGGYDRNLWSPEEVREKIDYIHANPVRRGLVARPADWPWSSWRAWHEGLDDPLAIDRETVPAVAR
jgi:putative transposase